jgi:pimeloyl-ACP methyl ester carboxylesterase
MPEPTSPADRSQLADDLVPPAPSTSRFIEANGLRLHYLDYGSQGRPPMLCVHGGAAHAHWFDFVASGFTADYHVMSLDLRGHGDSAWANPPAYAFKDYASDIAGFVEALGLKDFVLIGHSMGGMVSLLYAATYPGRVGKLVVVDSRLLLPVNRIGAMREAGTRAAKSYASQEELVSRYRLEPPGTHVAPPGRVHHIALHSGRAKPDGTWQHKFDRTVFVHFERREGMPLWDDIKIPALLLKGERSDRLGPDAVAQIKSRAPQVEMLEVSGADHHIMLDNPSGFVNAVRTFLSSKNTRGE